MQASELNLYQAKSSLIKGFEVQQRQSRFNKQ